MEQILSTLFEQLQPVLVQLIVLAITALSAWALRMVSKYLGDKHTKALSDLLHKALESSVKAQMASGARAPDTIATKAITDAALSIPETMRKLSPPREVALNIAKSKIIDVLASGALNK